MKQLIVILIGIFCFQFTISQTYFDPQNTSDIPIYSIQNFQTAKALFDLEQINSDFLDIVVTTEYSSPNRVVGHWNQNQGNGTFASANTPFLDDQSPLYSVITNAFVKTRLSSTVRDLIIGKTHGFELYWNDQVNHTITGLQQPWPLTGPSPYTFEYFEFGSFNTEDQTVDLEVSLPGQFQDNFYVVLNNGNGSFSNNQIMFSFPPNANRPSVFRLKQMNQKCEGFIQDDASDRADIAYICHSPDNTSYLTCRLNQNNDLFSSAPFCYFNTGIPTLSQIEVADLDNDGYNDIIVVGQDGGNFRAIAYRNIQGNQIDNNNPMWSITSAPGDIIDNNCKIAVSDLNKDGHNDLVLVSDNGLVSVFINRNDYPFFRPQPDQKFNIAGLSSSVTNQIKVADIYGGQTHDGGGEALIVSYSIPGTPYQFGVKVINAPSSNFATNPQPPIVQGLLEFDQTNNIWHPHLHINSKGERDISRYRIFKYHLHDPQGLHQVYESQGPDTGWTDYNECVNASGQDVPWYNCLYYGQSIDISNKISNPSQNAYYQVCDPNCSSCTPVCLTCGDGTSRFLNSAEQQIPKASISISCYPNPFNPIANINFSVSFHTSVRIEVFNVTGNRVAILTDKNYEPGNYNIIFDGKPFSSGVYFYKLTNGNSVFTGKLILLK